MNFSATGTDADGNALRYAWKFGDQDRNKKDGGTAAGQQASYTYAKFGTFVATVSVADRFGDGAAKTVAIAVTRGANRPPVARDMRVNNVIPFGNAVFCGRARLAVTLGATDEDGDPLSHRIVTQPEHGTLSGKGNRYTYTPATDYVGRDAFTFKASDSLPGKDGQPETSDSNVATVSLNVVSTTEVLKREAMDAMLRRQNPEPETKKKECAAVGDPWQLSGGERRSGGCRCSVTIVRACV